MLGAVARVPCPILPGPTRPLLRRRHCLPPETPMASATPRDGGTAKPDAAPAPTPLPLPPEKPLPGDCCGSGCVRCVWDIYFDELDAYDKALAAHAASSGSGGKDDPADTKPNEGLQLGCIDLRRATTPEMWGQDIEVPESILKFTDPMADDMAAAGVHAAKMLTPGAAMSGCRRRCRVFSAPQLEQALM